MNKTEIMLLAILHLLTSSPKVKHEKLLFYTTTHFQI